MYISDSKLIDHSFKLDFTYALNNRYDLHFFCQLIYDNRDF